MLVKDLMTPNPIHILPDVSVAEAGSMMAEHRIRHLPVLDAAGEVQGLVTRSSLDRALPGMGTGLTRFEINFLTTSTKVSEVMIEAPLSIGQDGAVEEAARIMNENRISSLLVMEQNKLVGIITDTDLFLGMLRMLGARRPGVRLMVHVPDRPGQIAKLSAAIAKVGGNISAMGGWNVDDGGNTYGVVLKIDNLTQEQVVSAVEAVDDVTVVDVRVSE